MRRGLRTGAAALTALTLLAMPAAMAQAPDVDHEAIARAQADRVILPGYEAFAAAGAAFAASASEAKAAGCPDPAPLRAGYHAAMDAWQGVQAIRLGPIQEADRHYRVQFWPDTRNLTARHLARLIAAGDPAALEPDAFAARSIAVQGFPALERLLFEDAAALTGGGDGAAYRCALVAAIAGNLARVGTRTLDGWRDGFRTALIAPGPDNPAFRKGAEATRALHGVLNAALESAIARKLDPVLGETAQDPRPRRAESWRAGRSLRNLRLNIDAMRASVMHGGFAEALDDPTLAENITGHLDAAREIAVARGDDLRAALADPDGRAALLAMRDRLKAAKDLVEHELAAHLDLTLGFNALDGD